MFVQDATHGDVIVVLMTIQQENGAVFLTVSTLQAGATGIRTH